MFQALRNATRAVAAAMALAVVASPALATWSIILVNVKTGEVAIGNATCIAGFNLETACPVLVVGKGAGCAQSWIDSTGQNRLVMFQGFQSSTPLSQILSQLSADPNLQTRQYGMVSLYGPDALTFTGTVCGAWAGGVTGQVGDIRYAIQGNVLSGACVVTAAEQSILNTPGDLAGKLMAAMRSAQLKGGDGRCSCSQVQPTSCGCPPATFAKSAHVGFMMIGRIGDLDGTCNTAVGCASGTYYMNLNVIGNTNDLDPVKQLQTKYNQWRSGWAGHGDHILSAKAFDLAGLPADGASQATLTIQLKDLNGAPLTTGGATVSVAHDASSSGSCAIGPVQDLGNGSYKVAVTAGTAKGLDVFRVTVNDGKGPVLLYPFPKLPIASLSQSYGQGTPGTAAATPVLDTVGASVVGNAGFQFRATQVLAGAPVSFVASSASAAIPFSPTGTLLVDPNVLLWIGGPVNADGTGGAAVLAPIPNDPLLSGLHAFVQALALDAGGDLGVSATQGLDVEIF